MTRHLKEEKKDGSRNFYGRFELNNTPRQFPENTMTKRKTITFLLPSPARVPAGGYKVAYEYANRLVADGHKVNVVYAGSLFFAKKTAYFKMTNCVRYVQSRVAGFSARKWFPLDKRVHEHLAFSLNDRHVPKSDIYIATSPYTAMYLKEYPVDGQRKFYFIQDYENWGNVTDEMLLATYHYDLRKIVISNWLQRIIESHGLECTLIPNGFNFDYFHLKTPIEKKDKYRITMLYHTMERKGCRYGFEALAIVKAKFPQLRVNLFGVPARPEGLPEWYEYHRCPDAKTHNRLYDEAALFLGTSNIEGWGLTVGEAMICGQTVVCTDNAGYREMALHERTALVSPVKDPEELARNLIRLIEDDTLRWRVAAEGHRFIQQFTWEKSYQKFKALLEA